MKRITDWFLGEEYLGFLPRWEGVLFWVGLAVINLLNIWQIVEKARKLLSL